MIDGSCYREGRNWKNLVIFGLHFLFSLPFSPSFSFTVWTPESEYPATQTKNEKEKKKEEHNVWNTGGCSFSLEHQTRRFLHVISSVSYLICPSLSVHPISLYFLSFFPFFSFPKHFAFFYLGTASEFWSTCVCHLVNSHTNCNGHDYFICLCTCNHLYNKSHGLDACGPQFIHRHLPEAIISRNASQTPQL